MGKTPATRASFGRAPLKELNHQGRRCPPGPQSATDAQLRAARGRQVPAQGGPLPQTSCRVEPPQSSDSRGQTPGHALPSAASALPQFTHLTLFSGYRYSLSPGQPPVPPSRPSDCRSDGHPWAHMPTSWQGTFRVWSLPLFPSKLHQSFTPCRDRPLPCLFPHRLQEPPSCPTYTGGGHTQTPPRLFEGTVIRRVPGREDAPGKGGANPTGGWAGEP